MAHRKARPTPLADRWPSGPVAIDTGTAEVCRQRTHPDMVTLYVNGLPSSAISLSDPTFLEFEYMQHMVCALDATLAPPAAVRALHIGGGACALPRALHDLRPGSHQVVVEIDATLAKAVRSWFDIPRAPHLKIRVGDGAAVVQNWRPGTLDLLVRDAFAADTTPAAMTTDEFVASAAAALSPHGLYLANCASRYLNDARAEAATALRHFAHVYVIAEPAQLRGRRYGNVVLVATHQPTTDVSALTRALARLPMPARLVHGADVQSFAAGAGSTGRRGNDNAHASRPTWDQSPHSRLGVAAKTATPNG